MHAYAKVKIKKKEVHRYSKTINPITNQHVYFKQVTSTSVSHCMRVYHKLLCTMNASVPRHGLKCSWLRQCSRLRTDPAGTLQNSWGVGGSISPDPLVASVLSTVLTNVVRPCCILVLAVSWYWLCPGIGCVLVVAVSCVLLLAVSW